VEWNEEDDSFEIVGGRWEDILWGMNMGKIEQFTDLQVWKNAHAFVLEAYRVTEGFPKTEMYGLTSQLRRAAVSVAANIAEGDSKNRDFQTKCAF